jgi:hypothetical protein
MMTGMVRGGCRTALALGSQGLAWVQVLQELTVMTTTMMTIWVTAMYKEPQRGSLQAGGSSGAQASAAEAAHWALLLLLLGRRQVQLQEAEPMQLRCVAAGMRMWLQRPCVAQQQHLKLRQMLTWRLMLEIWQGKRAVVCCGSPGGLLLAVTGVHQLLLGQCWAAAATAPAAAAAVAQQQQRRRHGAGLGCGSACVQCLHLLALLLPQGLA